MKFSLSLLPFVLVSALAALRAEEVALSSVLNVRDAEFELARPVLDKTVKNEPLRIAGQEYAQGVGVQVDTTIALAINGAQRFTASVGVDDRAGGSVDQAVSVEVQADGQSLWQGELRPGQAPQAIDVDVRGKHMLLLTAQDIGNARTEALVDWVAGKFTVEGEKPKSTAVVRTIEPPVILTPKPAAAPRLNSPRVFGVRPGHAFFFQIAATGERPLTFSAEGLPAGLQLDAKTGRITGVVTSPGSHRVTLRAKNAKSSAEAPLRIEVGENIALTPPLGWNSWNCWGGAVSQEKVLSSARALVAKGLDQHGWSYINIDDGWQATRGGAHQAIMPNSKFPDMAALGAEIHGLGLRFGIYSTPWIGSYEGHIGSSADNDAGTYDWVEAGNHNEFFRIGTDDTSWRKGRPGLRRFGKVSFFGADARQWAEWGVDYLKYDWNPNDVPHVTEAHDILRAQSRDIILSLSNSAPFSQAADWARLSQAWRTTGDITDTWGSMSRIGFSQEKWRPFGGPGHWNDPDMLVVGKVGWGPRLHDTRLAPEEQYTHITLWCLLSAPLLIGCDIAQMDDFTVSLLSNDEVLEIDQDELGRQAAQSYVNGRQQIWVKELADGSRAIGVFNLARQPQTIQVKWTQLGLRAPSRLRDLWRQKDLPADAETLSATVAPHGATLLRVWTP
jgi:alpha-galactosidase